MPKQGGFETLMLRLRAKPILTLGRWLGFDDRGTSIIVAAALLIGVAMRIAHNIFRAKIGAGGEAANVAVAIAEGRGFADPFHVGQGATAHLLPISPGIGGLVYSLFGVHSLPAEIILATWSIMLAFGSYVVFSHVFRRIGVTDQARAGALLLLSLVPVFVKIEAVDFRIWEGALAVMLSALFLLQATAAQPARTSGAAVLFALTAALLFFVNPIIGIGGFLCFGVLSRARWKLAKSISVIALTVLFSGFLVAPWALRNEQVLGENVLLRSNAGLELAIATDPAMLGSRSREQLYRERLSLLHPSQSPAAFDLMKQFGEVRYARMLGKQTLLWIREHPGAEARLLLLHLRETFAPEPWIFRVWGRSKWAVEQSVLVTMVGVAGLAGMFAAFIRKREGWRLIAIMILVPAVAMSPFQPINRYIYTSYAMLTFCAAEFLLYLFRRSQGWCGKLRVGDAA